MNLIVYSPAAVAQKRNTCTTFSPCVTLFLGFSRQLPRNSTPSTSGYTRQKYLVLESDLRRTVNSLPTATMMVSNFTQYEIAPRLKNMTRLCPDRHGDAAQLPASQHTVAACCNAAMSVAENPCGEEIGSHPLGSRKCPASKRHALPPCRT
jgi:hypothetical protein